LGKGDGRLASLVLWSSAAAFATSTTRFSHWSLLLETCIVPGQLLESQAPSCNAGSDHPLFGVYSLPPDFAQHCILLALWPLPKKAINFNGRLGFVGRD
jgi:hypothetical protein